MKLTVRGIVAFAVLTLAPCPARAQSLSLGVTDGLVTLDAQGVTIGEILARWTNATGAALVNGDKLASAPITLQFANIPERQALTMVLRSAGGYILVGRPDATDPVERIARVIIIAGAPGARTGGGSTPPPLLSSGTTAADLNAATARAAAALEAVQSPPPQQPALVSSAAAERTQLTPGNAYSLPPPVAVAPATTPATQSGAPGARASASPSGPSRPGVVAAPPAVPDPPPSYVPSGGAEQQRQQQQQQRTP